MTTATDTKALVERLNAEARHVEAANSYGSDVLAPLLRNAVEAIEALSSSASSETLGLKERLRQALTAKAFHSCRVGPMHGPMRDEPAILLSNAIDALCNVTEASLETPQLASQRPEKTADDAPYGLSCDPADAWALGYNAAMGEVYSSSETPIGGGVKCGGCGLPYQHHGCDVTLPDDQWRVVNGREGGVLCGTCIAQRASGIPGSIAIRARIEFVGESTARTPEFERGYFAGSGDWSASAASIASLERERDDARAEALRLREELSLANDEAKAALTPEGQANAIAQLQDQLRVERSASSETQEERPDLSEIARSLKRKALAQSSPVPHEAKTIGSVLRDAASRVSVVPATMRPPTDGEATSSETPIIAAILADYPDELDKAACDRCEHCSPLVMCSFHSVLSMLQGHTVPTALLAHSGTQEDPWHAPKFPVLKGETQEERSDERLARVREIVMSDQQTYDVPGFGVGWYLVSRDKMKAILKELAQPHEVNFSLCPKCGVVLPCLAHGDPVEPPVEGEA